MYYVIDLDQKGVVARGKTIEELLENTKENIIDEFGDLPCEDDVAYIADNYIVVQSCVDKKLIIKAASFKLEIK